MVTERGTEEEKETETQYQKRDRQFRIRLRNLDKHTKIEMKS